METRGKTDQRFPLSFEWRDSVVGEIYELSRDKLVMMEPGMVPVSSFRWGLSA
jgi:hypothetical protein